MNMFQQHYEENNKPVNLPCIHEYIAAAITES